MKTIVTCQLDPELFHRVTRFADAACTTKAGVTRRALEDFIEKALAENAGVRARFDRYMTEDKSTRQWRGTPKLTVIK